MRYRLIEANKIYPTLSDRYILEQQMLNEGVLDWFKKSMSALNGKVITVDWNKAEKQLGGPVPQEIRQRVEKYLNGKSFKFYKFVLLSIFICGTLGGTGLLVGYLRSKATGITGEVALAKLFAGVISSIGSLIILKCLGAQSGFMKSGIGKYDKSMGDLSSGSHNEAAWSAVLNNIKTKEQAGENWGFSKILWLGIILTIIGTLVSVAFLAISN